MSSQTSDKVNLCAMLPRELYEKVTEERGAREQTLSQYVEQILKEHFEGKAGKNMNTNTRTLAFQVSEELFQRIKDYLRQNGVTQREFVVGLIEKALEEWEKEDEDSTQSEANIQEVANVQSEGNSQEAIQWEGKEET